MVSRRAFLKLTGAASLAAGCGVEPLVNRDPRWPPPPGGAPDDDLDPVDALADDEDGSARDDVDPLVDDLRR